MFEVKLGAFVTFIFILHKTQSDSTGALEVIPERAVIDYVNPKYAKDAFFNVRRISKKDGYVANAGGVIFHNWGNNITVDVILYEYLHNEYKRSFVEFHFKLCDMINKDEFIGKVIARYLSTCPLPKGYIEIRNATMKIPTFPYVFPFQKCKAEIIIKLTEPPQEVVARGGLFIKIRQLPSNKAK